MSDSNCNRFSLAYKAHSKTSILLKLAYRNSAEDIGRVRLLRVAFCCDGAGSLDRTSKVRGRRRDDGSVPGHKKFGVGLRDTLPTIWTTVWTGDGKGRYSGQSENDGLHFEFVENGVSL